MRWQGQKLGVDDTAALPGMERMDGLVRSVTTPEFAGMTFHEVVAKTALNRVPGASAMPFDWTVNPYRGCSHACAYCLSSDTLIMTADGRHVPLGEVKVGDEIVGTERQGVYRRYVRTEVLAKWPTRKRAFRVTLADGTDIVASADHRFLTERGWKFVRGAMQGREQRPYLTTSNRLQGFGLGAQPAMTRKRDVVGAAVKTSSDLRVVAVEDLGYEIDMVDITTGTGDFIANGVVSHNCFARKTHEYLDLDSGADFDSQIVVKVNVADVLRSELRRGSWTREPVMLGTNTDPYQRAEGRYRLMPDIIGALTENRTPFSILTKGTLLRRDLPLLTDAAREVRVTLAMSIAVFDDALQRSLEPGTPTAEARLDTVRAATEAGFRVTVFLMPILPHLTDSVAALDHALGRIRAAGASRVVYGALHLRPGAKEWFLQWLEREHPELVSSYRGLYPGVSVQAPQAYRRWLGKRVQPLLRMHRLDGWDEDDHPRGRPQPGLADRTATSPRLGPVRNTGSAASARPSVAPASEPTLF